MADSRPHFDLDLSTLNDVFKLVAFAVEARRVLQGVNDFTAYRPDHQRKLADCVPCFNNWAELPDTAGVVMQWATAQVDTLLASTDHATSTGRA